MAKRAPKAASAAASLQSALKFAAVAFKSIGAAYTTHVVLHNKCLFAFDSIVAAGHPIDDELSACPHGARLAQALARPGSGLSIGQAADGSSLTVKVGKFKGVVPCIPFADIPPFGPDANIAPIDDRIKVGFSAIMHLTSDNAPTMIASSILLRANTMVSTNRAVIMEFWHGNNLPPDLALPKVFCSAVAKCDKPLVGFGYSDSTVTFWFDDGSWLRTQRYAERWPVETIEAIFSKQAAPAMAVLPDGFFEGVDAVSAFASEDKAIYSTKDGLCTRTGPGGPETASYKVPGMQAGIAMHALALKMCADRFQQVSWGTDGEPVMFFGATCRAAMTRHNNDAQTPAEDERADTPNSIQVPSEPSIQDLADADYNAFLATQDALVGEDTVN